MPIPAGWVPPELLNQLLYGESSSDPFGPLEYSFGGTQGAYNPADYARFLQQNYITPPGSDASMYYIPDGGDVMTGYTPEQRALIESAQNDARLRGIGSVAALVGGAAALGATPWGSQTLGGGMPAGAVVGPNGLPTGAMGAAGGGVGTLSGSVPAVGAAPGIGLGAAGLGGNVLDSSGSVIPGTEAVGGGTPSWLQGLLGGGSALSDWAPLIGGLLGAIDANNQPDSMSTNTGGTSSSIYGTVMPEALMGPAGNALTMIQGLYNYGRPVAGVNSATTDALSRLQNLGSNPFASGGMGNTVPTSSGFASGQYQNAGPTMSGFASGAFQNNAPTTSSFASGAGINPYLDSVFNTAADSTQNRLATEFAHAGRLNSDSHGQARSQELQNLAAGIYGPGFEAERSRQYGAQESGIDRLIAQMEGNLGRQYGASESGLSRLLAQTEGNLGRQYGASESALGRLLAQSEGNLGRQYGAIESDLGRQLASVYPMLEAGDYLRNVEQQGYNAPYDFYNQYMTSLQGLLPFFPGQQTQSTTQTGQVTQPLFSNPLAGFLGGAQLGSLFGG